MTNPAQETQEHDKAMLEYMNIIEEERQASMVKLQEMVKLRTDLKAAILQADVDVGDLVVRAYKVNVPIKTIADIVEVSRQRIYQILRANNAL